MHQLPNRLTVVAPAFYNTPKAYSWLVQSCITLELNLHLYGMNEPWPWLLDAKVLRLIVELKKLNSQYVLITDAGDSFILDEERIILEKFQSLAESARRLTTGFKNIVVSAEKNCWPQPMLAELFQDTESPWRYVNSGGYMGEREEVIWLLEEMARVKSPYVGTSEIPCRSRDLMNDQFLMTIKYLTDPRFCLDSDCDLFQTMGDLKTGEVEWDDIKLHNLITDTHPSVMHFNGHARGIEKAFHHRFSRPSNKFLMTAQQQSVFI